MLPSPSPIDLMCHLPQWVWTIVEPEPLVEDFPPQAYARCVFHSQTSRHDDPCPAPWIRCYRPVFLEDTCLMHHMAIMAYEDVEDAE
jgi:hypothetical protein